MAEILDDPDRRHNIFPVPTVSKEQYDSILGTVCDWATLTREGRGKETARRPSRRHSHATATRRVPHRQRALSTPVGYTLYEYNIITRTIL